MSGNRSEPKLCSNFTSKSIKVVFHGHDGVFYLIQLVGQYKQLNKVYAIPHVDFIINILNDTATKLVVVSG